MKIDLHSHTNVSDGINSPSELVSLAKAEAISVLAITDHDTLEGWQALMALKAPAGAGALTIVPGAEISCRTANGMSVHMLGYLFDPMDAELNQTMSLTRDDRIPRMKKIIGLLNEAGIEISFVDVAKHSESAQTVGRPHLADALIERGVVSSRDEAFKKYLHNDSPFYVGHFAPTPEEAISAIKRAGGVSILAHGLAGSRGAIYSTDEIALLLAHGLDGLEVNHRDHDDDARNTLRDMARAFDVFATGSSDYHGAIGSQRLGMEQTAPDVWEGILAQGEGCEVFTV